RLCVRPPEDSLRRRERPRFAIGGNGSTAARLMFGRSRPCGYCFVIWPRISPPGCSLVWTLAYHLPAMRSDSCWSVSVAVPLCGLVGLVPHGTTTPALAPGAAGPWKCAAVAGPLRSFQVAV